MAVQLILYIFIILMIEVCTVTANYCFGYYTTYYYSFYCSGTCCGYYYRYCCYNAKISDAVIVGVILGVLIVIVVIIVIVFIAIKKCNRRPIQPGIILSTHTMSYRPRRDIFITNPQLYKNFELPPYTPATDPPEYESIAPSAPQHNDQTSTESNVRSTQSNENIISSHPPMSHRDVADTEL